MPESALQAAVDHLYEVSLEAFVAERTRLAKELRSSGERAAAGELAKLRKPTAPEWALNFVAREQPRELEAWLDAAAALRDASQDPGGTGAESLRAAMAVHRKATARLLELVSTHARPGSRPLTEAMVDRVRTLLQGATADPALAERLRAGRVSEEEAPVEAFASLALGTTPTPRRPPAKSRPAKPSSAKADAKADTKADSKADAKAEAEAAAMAARRADLQRRARRAEEEIRRLRKVVARRAAAAESADGRRDEARRALHRAESEASAAHEAVEEAEAVVAGAERDLSEIRAELGAAG